MPGGGKDKKLCNWIQVKMVVKDEQMNDAFLLCSQTDLSDTNVIRIINHGPATAQNHCFDIPEPISSISTETFLVWISSPFKSWMFSFHYGAYRTCRS